MSKEEFLVKLEQCIRCGSCKTRCPTYETEKNEALSGRGRLVILEALISGALPETGTASDRVLSCIQCGACAESCPLGIEIPELIYSGRTFLRRGRGNVLRTLTGLALKYPDVLLSIARPLRRPLIRTLIKQDLVPHDFHFPESRSTRNGWKMNGKSEKGAVMVFAGCSGNYIYPGLRESTERVLDLLGYEVLQPEKELCCGSPFRSMGMEKKALAFARQNLAMLGGSDVLATISPCPTCILTLRNEYRSLAGEGVENTMDISQFLLAYEPELFAQGETGRKEGCYYHDPCHMQYGLELVQEPRDILRSCGIALQNEKEGRCCGFGGTFRLRYPNISERLSTELQNTIEKESTSDIFTSCPGCLLQLKRTVKGRKVYHIIEAVEKTLRERF